MRYKPLDPGFAPPLKLRRHAVARVTAFCETVKPGFGSRWHPTFTQDTSNCRYQVKFLLQTGIQNLEAENSSMYSTPCLHESV